MHNLLSSDFRRKLHGIIKSSILEKFLKLHFKESLINQVLPLLYLFTFKRVIQDVQNIDAVCTYLKHLFVRIDFIHCLISQFHFVFDSLAERRKWILIIKICLFPENTKE